MNIAIIVGFFISLILLQLFYMHMFQLNSYFLKKHAHWMKVNHKRIITQTLFIVIAAVLALLNNVVASIISIIILSFLVLYNLPKGKAKISLKYTSRVKRMLITELGLIVLVMLIGGIKNYLIIKLTILNVLSPIICVVANFINYPIEANVRNYYINDAKKILKGMPNLIVIGVTGSYGKTSVKNFLVKTLSAKYEVLTTPKNYNTTMGVVKTIRENLKPTHQIFVCEMGATKLNDIKEICDIVNPTMGIITAVGPQHLESFKSIENVVKTKFELADSVKKNNGVVFLNHDNEYIANKDIDMKKYYYGINDSNLDYNAYDLKSSSTGLSFKMKDENGNEIEFKTKLIGDHNILNLTVAIAVANYMGIPMSKLVSRIREIQSVEHRLELIPKGQITIIDDSYNSNPISSKSALNALAEFEGTKVIVTPGLIELGVDEEKYNFEFGKYMTDICDYIFLVGEKQSKAILEGIKSKVYDEKKVFIVNTPQEAVNKVSTLGIKGNIIVLLENDLPDNYNVK